MHCWICGKQANSAEHMVKASDFRTVFGHVTHKSPVYRHSIGDINRPIRGTDVSPIKFEPSLCQECNNARTQPHDRAWAKFVANFRALRPRPKAGETVRMRRIYPTSLRESSIALHLYFLKQLGCHSVQNNVPLPIHQFATCILSGNAHPCVRLIFVSVAPGSSKYQIQVGEINALNRGGKTVSAVWHYRIETLGVFVSYAEPGHPLLTDVRGWHPEDIGVTRFA